jgi:hypothetical protein
MPLEAFHRITGGRVQEITARVRFEPLNLKSFDPVTQEIYWDRFLQQSTHIPSKNQNLRTGYGRPGDYARHTLIRTQTEARAAEAKMKRSC